MCGGDNAITGYYYILIYILYDMLATKFTATQFNAAFSTSKILV